MAAGFDAGSGIRLCYVDGFAGPWKSKNGNLEDSSIAIGLRALEAAAKTWSERGANVNVEAAFVEKGHASTGQTAQPFERKRRPSAVASESFAAEVIARFDANARVQVEAVPIDGYGGLVGRRLMVAG